MVDHMFTLARLILWKCYYKLSLIPPLLSLSLSLSHNSLIDHIPCSSLSTHKPELPLFLGKGNFGEFIASIICHGFVLVTPRNVHGINCLFLCRLPSTAPRLHHLSRAVVPPAGTALVPGDNTDSSGNSTGRPGATLSVASILPGHHPSPALPQGRSSHTLGRFLAAHNPFEPEPAEPGRRGFWRAHLEPPLILRRGAHNRQLGLGWVGSSLALLFGSLLRAACRGSCSSFCLLLLVKEKENSLFLYRIISIYFYHCGLWSVDYFMEFYVIYL